MPRLSFQKGQGTGNDFVLVADPGGDLHLRPSDVARLCDRRFGVGADGLLRAVRVAVDAEGASAAADDPSVAWFMDYRNADGSAAEMCGNGIRVFTAFLLEQGLLDLDAGETVRIATRGGIVPVRRTTGGFAADLGRWSVGDEDVDVRCAGLDVVRPGLAVTVPNPHVVVVVADDAELDAADLSVAPVLDPAPAAGANVELVRPAEPLVADGVGRIRMRVHERGSGETLSCGTGAAAAAIAVRHFAGAAAPLEWEVQVAGGVLRVRVLATADGEHAELEGPADLVFSGVVDL